MTEHRRWSRTEIDALLRCNSGDAPHWQKYNTARTLWILFGCIEMREGRYALTDRGVRMVEAFRNVPLVSETP